MVRYVFTFALILLAAMSRLLPHPPNFAPITALALFGGVYLDRRLTFAIPLLAMFLSDWVIGLYPEVMWVYGSFLAVGMIGLWLRNHPGLVPSIGATLAGSILFFLVTNFGVWVTSQVAYPRTVAGLLECYTVAIPFFRNTLLGDFVYVGVMFGVYEFAAKYIPSLRPQRLAVRI